MKKILFAGAAVALALSVSGCTSAGGLPLLGGGQNPVDFLNAVNQHLEGCDRTYQGSTTPVPSITIHIDCKARPAAAAPSVPASTPATP